MGHAIGFYVTGEENSNVENGLFGVLLLAALFLFFYIGGWGYGDWWFLFRLLVYIYLTCVIMGLIPTIVDSLNCKDEQTAWVVGVVLGVPTYLACAKLGAMWVW